MSGLDLSNQSSIMPLVSVVTPAYNAEKFIEDTLLSVKNQNYVNLEHIVIDDGSTDDTKRILRHYEDEYNLVWFTKPNEGQTITTNMGFDIAKGEIVIWLNADDILFDKKAISYLVEQFQKNPEVGIIYGNHAIIDERNRILGIKNKSSKFSYNRLLRSHFAACIFFRKKIVEKYKLDIMIDLPMDYEQCLRMAYNGEKFMHVNKILFAYRIHSGTKTLNMRHQMKIETIKLQMKYGQKYNMKYWLLKCVDEINDGMLRICGIKYLIELYFDVERYDLTVQVKFDSLFKSIIRQFPLIGNIYR